MKILPPENEARLTQLTNAAQGNGITDVVQVMISRWLDWLPSNRLLYQHDRVALPPLELRAAGQLFRSDASFCRFARRDVEAVARHTSLAGKSLLDFGCGAGRFYFGLRRRDEPAFYLGVDVRANVIAWAEQHVSLANSRFQFARSNVQNERYNPHGTLNNRDWTRVVRQPFDVIQCYSVLSHLILDDATEVLDLFASLMKPESLLFLTAFVSENSDDVALNPDDMGIDIHGPLHVVRYRRSYFHDMLSRHFHIVDEQAGVATDGQTLFILRLRKVRGSNS